MAWLTTATVLQNLRDYENRAAWESFTDRFRQPVVSFVRGMGLNSSDAEDVAQDTLLAFAEAYRRGQYDPQKGRLSRFLFGIAYRQALRARRLAHPDIKVETRFWSQLPDEQTASGIWDIEWERAVLDRCLARARQEFEPQTFRAFELVVREGRSATEAADELGIGIKSVYNAKHRILRRIRELREDFDTQA